MALRPRDLLSFTAGTIEQRKTFALNLVEDYRRTGFAKMINHGITDDEVRKLFDFSKRLFLLPEQTKQSIAHIPGPDPQRGWSRVGAENSSKLFASEFSDGLSREDLSDCREHFDMGLPTDSEFQNRWTDEKIVSGFRATMEEYFHRLASVTVSLLEALELGLSMPQGAFTNRVSNAASELRLLHYPTVDIQTLKNGKVNRIWPHFDLGVITLLFQDMSGGLEMQDRDKPKEFVPVLPTSSSEMVTNISETLQRWTNGELQAGLHQVTIPPSLKHKDTGVIADRYSIAFFSKADRHTSVGPIPLFVSEVSPAAYEEMSAIEYQQRRLRTAY